MSPKTYTVSSTQALHTALKAARGGDTIELKSGIYEGIDIRDAQFNEAVTITSADPDDPAVLHNKTSVRDSSNLTFDNLVMQHTDSSLASPNSSFKALFYLDDSNGITLQNSTLQGQEAEFTDASRNLHEGFPFGKGVQISNSSDVLITKNEITDLFAGIGLGNTEDVTISNNHIHKMRVDGIAGTDQRNTVIEENLFEHFTPYRVDPENPSGATDDHSDMIQYWGSNADFGIDGFTVRNNVFLQDTIGTQTIFGRLNLRNTDDPDNISFTNFEVSGNLIYNGHANGITLSDVTGAKVFDNTVLANEMVLEDFRNVPTVNIRYDGLRAVDKGFSLKNDDVQTSRDIEVYNNVLSYAHTADVVIRAYSKHVNEREDVTNALNISEQDNHWISTKLPSAEYHDFIFKLAYKPEADKSTLSLDGRSAGLYGEAGSDYYTDPAALQALFDKLNTNKELKVNTDLSDIDLGDLPNVGEISTNLKVIASVDDESADEEPVQTSQHHVVRAKVTGQSEDVAKQFSASLTHTGDDSNNTNSLLRGKNEDDVIAGFAGNDFLNAGGGDDLAYGGAGEDRIYGKNGNDALIGGSGDDYLHGGSGADLIVAGAGQDTLIGGGQDDILVSSGGNNQILGGGGFDVVVLDDDPAKYDIYLTNKVLHIEHLASGHIDEVKQVEAIYFKDVDALYSVDRRSGETTFLNRSKHEDTYATLRDIPAEAYESDVMETESGAAPDTSGNEDPIVNGTNERDILWGNSSTEAIFGLGGNDRIFGQGDDDLLIGGKGRDILRGDAGDDALVGGSGHDKLFGQAGADLLLGGSGKDFISGGANNDIVVGGLGNDNLVGGRGIDTAVFAGRYQDYKLTTNSKTDVTKVTHKSTGEADLLAGIEQLYFDQQNRLYALSEDGNTNFMRASQHAEDYAIFKDAPWDAYSDEMIY